MKKEKKKGGLYAGLSQLEKQAVIVYDAEGKRHLVYDPFKTSAIAGALVYPPSTALPPREELPSLYSYEEIKRSQEEQEYELKKQQELEKQKVRLKKLKQDLTATLSKPSYRYSPPETNFYE